MLATARITPAGPPVPGVIGTIAPPLIDGALVATDPECGHGLPGKNLR